MKNRLVLAGLVLFLDLVSYSQNSVTSFSQPPAWSKIAIWYQLFVERFNNGDKTNDPKPENMDVPFINIKTPEGWSVTPWSQDWYTMEDWAKKSDMSFDDAVQYRRYGGDIQGVLNKLDYLQDLGVTALFMNPVNDAPSLHKYDVRNFHHIDVNFGPDPIGDNKLIAAENPDDPSTWTWTAADKLFLKLVAEAHKRGMKIIMDYSWNETGTNFWAWQDVVKNHEKSKYKDWYAIQSFDKPETPENEFSYSGWMGIASLPELKKANITSKREPYGYPYEGNINEGAKNHIFSVTRKWLAPDGDVTKGIDGFRLDVADQIGLGFWRDFRKLVRSIQPEAYLVGEIWWEDWPEKLMNPVPYTRGDAFDAVMFYQVYRPARYFFAVNNYSMDAITFKDSLEMQWNRLPESNRYAMMNVSSTHDSPRLLTDFYNPNKYKFNSKSNDDINYKTGKPDEDTYKRLRLYLVHLFTTVGAPQIWNGEEMGMWGADDPHNRKPLLWKEMKFDPETSNFYQTGEKQFDKVEFNQLQFDWYKKLIKIRKDNPVLSSEKIEFITAEGKKLSYKRFDDKNEIIVLFNVEGSTQEFTLPENGKYVDLLTNSTFSGPKIKVKSLQALVLKRLN